jgi:hypothetical protein
MQNRTKILKTHSSLTEHVDEHELSDISVSEFLILFLDRCADQGTLLGDDLENKLR